MLHIKCLLKRDNSIFPLDSSKDEVSLSRIHSRHMVQLRGLLT